MTRLVISLITSLLWILPVTVLAGSKPNILVIWGDDIGWLNISAYNDGLMGYQTPNIDRIAEHGIRFTDHYGEQSCTAGRSAFITGQHPVRTGLTRVGVPGSLLGIQPEDPTLAALLKNFGYATGQFGKNHLGDRSEFLPTEHGFDIFFGNLYHLNAEQAPEHPDYPKNPLYKQLFGPRGVVRSSADGQVEDTGPLTIKRMESVDAEFLAETLRFIDDSHDKGVPFFAWFNSTRMHTVTHLSDKWKGKTGQGVYADGMQEHDSHVGALLDKLDELGITENTLVFYSTDNGAQLHNWPDGGMTPFRGVKNTTWEGGFRVPAIVSWPKRIQPGISNQVMSHLDWLPTILAAVGEPKIKDKLLEGYVANGKRYKVHLDGYNFLPHLTGAQATGPRKEFFYFTDGGMLSAVRVGDWKGMFAQQRAVGFDVWNEPYTQRRLPAIYNLRRDPLERAEIDSGYFVEWYDELLPAVTGLFYLEIQKFLATFEEFPQRQSPSFNMIQAVDKAIQGGN
ncbi:arylsulfatase [Parahaliea mediterranea]|uniref:arylsulfatase n=1 Tax=Parahaliea mediterranea TaxID=651086 RepID=UPI000E2ED94F|nr:arylsulfatase [Parahaliea mediterranea]